METVDKIKDHIAKGETDKALELLIKYAKEERPTMHDEAILLSGQYRQWKRSTVLGIEQSSNDLRRIDLGILNLLQNPELSNEQPVPPVQSTANRTTTSPPPPTAQKINFNPIILGVLGLMALGLVGFWMTKDDGHDHINDNITAEVTPPKETETTKPTTNNNTTTKPEKPKDEPTTKPAGSTKLNTNVIKPAIKDIAISPTATTAIKKTELNSNITKAFLLNKVTAKNIQLVDYGNGYFRYLGGKEWREEDKNMNRKKSFQETGRDASSVYLYNKSQKMKIQLDLHRKMITYADSNNPKARDLYKMKNSFSAVKGKQVKKVVYAKAIKTGSFQQVSGSKKWVEKNHGTNKTIDTFNEYDRDEWSVYLSNNAKEIRLDLYKKKIMYAPKGGTVSSLYDISASY